MTIFPDVFIKNYNKDSKIGYTLEVNVELDVEYRYYLQIYHFCQKKVANYVSKLMYTFENKINYTIPIRLLQQALNMV